MTIFAHTHAGFNLPDYINLTRNAKGEVDVTVRGAGITSIIGLTEEQYQVMVRELVAEEVRFRAGLLEGPKVA